MAELWRRVARWRVPARWYLIVVLLAIALPVVPVGIAALAGVTQLRGVNVLGPAYAVFLTFAQILTSGLGEEPGWRGFLLARLQARSSGQKYIWTLGLAWAVWHYPVTILQTLSAMQNVTVAQAIVTILVSLAGHTMSLIGMTYLYVWLVKRTRSVFLAILLHALANVANTMVLSLVTDQQAITMLIALMPWVVVLVQQRALGKERFPGRPASG